MTLVLTLHTSCCCARPPLNAAQMEDMVTVPTAPDGRVHADTLAADHALVRVVSQLLNQGTYNTKSHSKTLKYHNQHSMSLQISLFMYSI